MKRPALLGVAIATMVVLSSAAGYRGAGRVAPPSCNIRGVWDMVEIIQAGKTTPVAATGGQQRKIVSAKYYMWLRQDMRRDTLPMKTELDTLKAYFTPGGSGTYTLSGNTYTEHLEYFVEPAQIGKSFVARCRVDGNRWYHTYDNAQLSGPNAPHDTVIEVYQRVE